MEVAMKLTLPILIAASFAFGYSAQASSWSSIYTSAGQKHSVVFVRKDEILIEEPYDTRYRILENNDHAILAEYHYADFDPVLTSALLFITTLMIDKSSLRFTHTTSVSGSEAKQFSGICRLRLSTRTNIRL
jgi:hypothetical protein